MSHPYLPAVAAAFLLVTACAPSAPSDPIVVPEQGAAPQQTTDRARAIAAPQDETPEVTVQQPLPQAVVSTVSPDPHDGDEVECDVPMPPPNLLIEEWFPHNDAAYRDHYSIAASLIDEGRYDDAIKELRMELFDAPDSGTTWFLLGQTYAALGRKEQALDAVTESLSIDPQLEDALAFLARFHLEEGQPGASRAAAETLVALRPFDAEASHLLARAQMGLAMWSEAIATCERTIEIDAEFTRAYNNLSFSALQIGKNELARDTLSAAADLPGIEAYMLNNLGLAYERTGDSAEAIRTFARAIELQPSYSRASLNRSRLQKQVDEEVAAELARILAERDADTETTMIEAAASVAPTTVPFPPELAGPDTESSSATP